MSKTLSEVSTTSSIHLIRHGEALHNVDRAYPHRDPPLTAAGEAGTRNVQLPVNPDLILISPMTRTIQTAMNVFPFLQKEGPFPTPVQIWPDLREANDAICNKGLPRATMQANFPQFDFCECRDEWDYAPHTVPNAIERAERVRARLASLAPKYPNMVVITHRGLLAFLVKGRRFNVCEARSYRFVPKEEVAYEEARRGLNCDTLKEQDFGPTVLVFVHNPTAELEASEPKRRIGEPT
jgi:broad specificity phosphatase PhoE